MLGIILLTIASPLLLWLVYWYYNVTRFEKYLKNIPGPPRIPLLGNALEIADSRSILPRLLKRYDEFKCSFKMYVGCQPYLFVCDNKDLELLLSSSTIIKKSDVYAFVGNWLGQGLLTGFGDRWKKHRKIITPAFHFQILEEFIDVFNIQSEILVSKLNSVADKGTFNIYPFVTRCALDIICETAMGTSVKAQDDLDSEYVKSVNTLLEVLVKRAFSPIYANNLIYRFTSTYQQERDALKVVHGYAKSVIDKRKNEFLKNRKDSSVDSVGIKKKRAFLDLLLSYSAKDPSFTDDDIRQEVDTFMFEGHDTTATSTTFALHSLAVNPDVQQKVYKELQEIFSDDVNRSPTHRDLQEMKYLDMAIKESLRIYATVPMIGRELEKDTNWNGTILPKGLMFNIFIHGVHNSSLKFKNPEKFDPDRFTAENSQERDSFAYIPFSAGARNCIGQKFAILEMKSIISYVLRNFELLPPIPDHKMILKSEAVLKSDNGVLVRLKKRK